MQQPKHEGIICCQNQTAIIQQNFFSKDLLAIEMKKKQIYMNKHHYLSLSVLEIRKIVMHEFWSDYMKQKYEEKEK